MDKNIKGEWSEKIYAFWFGANGCEYIAWKGAFQIMVYPTHEHPNPPSKVLISNERIETLEQFSNVLNNGVEMDVSYSIS